MDAPDEWTPVLRALIDAPVAWQSPGELARATGTDPDALTDLLADMNVSGWIDVWDHPDDGPLVTLTPLGAERLGVALVASTRSEVYRWSYDSASSRSRDRRAAPEAAPSSVLDALPDHRALAAEDLDALLDHLDAIERKWRPPPIRMDDLPFPTIVLGTLDPWEERARRRKGDPNPKPCRCCRGRTLGPTTVCLSCLRWGMDGYFAKRARQARALEREAG